MSDYQFTHDWFAQAEQVWPQLIPHLPGEGVRDFLEIGSFEGRSSVWIVENMLRDGDTLTCVDTWQGGEEHSAEDMAAVEARFDHNMAVLEKAYPQRGVFKHKGTSTFMLGGDLYHDPDPKCRPSYDFIYIDGSHIAKDVLTDACMAWPLLNPKGMMVFDDYMWGNPRDVLHRPKAAIDAFCNIFAEEVDIIHIGYQAVVRKRGEG